MAGEKIAKCITTVISPIALATLSSGFTQSIADPNLEPHLGKEGTNAVEAAFVASLATLSYVFANKRHGLTNGFIGTVLGFAAGFAVYEVLSTFADSALRSSIGEIGTFFVKASASAVTTVGSLKIMQIDDENIARKKGEKTSVEIENFKEEEKPLVDDTQQVKLDS